MYLVSRAGVSVAIADEPELVLTISQAYVDGVFLCVDGGRVLVANGQE